jgi:hypothetical protein
MILVIPYDFPMGRTMAKVMMMALDVSLGGWLARST